VQAKVLSLGLLLAFSGAALAQTPQYRYEDRTTGRGYYPYYGDATPAPHPPQYRYEDRTTGRGYYPYTPPQPAQPDRPHRDH
jgi:hypothetical protein